jgi:serine/threonine protein kinase/tetratricopeptide (TPR) repeat protein
VIAGSNLAAAVAAAPAQVDFGPRYRVEAMLGEGGMGAVYKAYDIELDRMVALKLVRPELTRDPGVYQRFKQELLLASKISHKNILRTHDLGEAPGVKFISMAYVEGQDLRQLIVSKGKLPVDRAVNIARQLCAALDAAHSEGVVHRDLKPQNVLVDRDDTIYVSDFGLAKSLESDLGMTNTGQFLGTPRYMSPEQAEAKAVDHRSDLYAFGLILCEMLTADIPFESTTSALQMMFQRVQNPPKNPQTLDPNMPAYLARIIQKCLERDPERRYQSAREILADLDAARAPARSMQITLPSKRTSYIVMPLVLVLVALIVLAAVYRTKLFPKSGGNRPAVSGPVASLAVLPFRNASGDSSLDWLGGSLADMLSTDVGQSSQLRTVTSNRLHQILNDLKISSAMAFDPATIRRVADFSSADHVVWGQFAKFGDQIRIDATLQDLKNDRAIPLKVDVPSEKEIPSAIDKLADSIRQNLSLPRDVVRELKASAFQPTSTSVEALREYNQGVGLQRDGRNLEAQKRFEDATKLDPAFALAFSKLAQSYSNLGYDNEAEQSAQKAVDLSQKLPTAEKYLIAAIRAQVAKNYPDAIQAYENLAKASPDNADVQSALADLFEQSGDLSKAADICQRILAADPKDISAVLAAGRLAIKKGDPQASLDPLNRALTLSIQIGNDEQKAVSLHAMAVAYRMLNKLDEALRNDQEALTIWRRIGQKRGIASSLNEMARVEVLQGNSKAALASFQEALELRRDIGDKRGLGDTLIDLGNFYDDHGDHDQALKMYKQSLQIQRDIGNERLQAACLNNVGAVYFEKAQYEDARTYYQQALQLQEKSKSPEGIVEGVHNLAETSVKMGEYNQAASQYMRALELRRSLNDSRGAAIESYTLGTMLDLQGRFGPALDSKRDALKTFTDLKDKTFWMAEILGGYGQALVLAGRGDEAKTYLDQALSLARELKNDGLVSQTLGFQGDVAYFRGDSKSARSLYEQALQAATRSKEPDKILVAKIDLARVAVQEGHAQQAISSLHPLIQQADDLGLKHLSTECSISMAEAMIVSHDNARARQELERALARADKLGLQPLSVKAHYLLGNILRTSGNQADAQQHYRDVLQLLDGMRKDAGADNILQRSDFKAIYDESTHWTKAS